MNNVELLPTVYEKGQSESLIKFNQENNWPDLKPDVKVMAAEYAVCGVIKDAAKAAGISKVRASRLLRDPLVAAYVGMLTEEISERTLIRREFLELEAIDLYEKNKGEEEVPLVLKDGEQVMARQFNSAGANAALKNLMVLAGITSNEGADKNKGGVNIQINLDRFLGQEEKPIDA